MGEPGKDQLPGPDDPGRRNALKYIVGVLGAVFVPAYLTACAPPKGAEQMMQQQATEYAGGVEPTPKITTITIEQNPLDYHLIRNFPIMDKKLTDGWQREELSLRTKRLPLWLPLIMWCTTMVFIRNE